MISWITPAGLLFTATEMVATSTNIVATGTSTTYTKLSGELPSGLSLSSTGLISGTPNYVLDTKRSTFTVRANSGTFFIDRQFSIDVTGSDSPMWDTYTITTSTTTGTLTTSTGYGYIALGLNNEPYAMYNQWVDYQLQAHPVEAPTTATLEYYIYPGDGVLPAGLTLDKTGRIYGYVSRPTPVTENDDEFCYPNISFNYDQSAASTGTVYVVVGNGYRLHSVNITVTDGVYGSKKAFKLLVIDPMMFSVGSGFYPSDVDVLDPSIVTITSSYLQSPQFVNSSTLGKFKVDYNVYSPVNAYDPAPNFGPVIYAINTASATILELPDYLSLNTSTGYIVGFPGQQREYRKQYQLTINASKYNLYNTDAITATNTFTFIVQNGLENFINWEETGSLGTLLVNETSELYVKAITTASVIIKYQIIDGALPNGLTLNPNDGTIIGSAIINTATITTSTDYNFTVAAIDNNNNQFIDGEFSITIDQTTSTDYTSIWCKPYLSLSERSSFNSFINNERIFTPDSLYRPFDPDFGLQTSLKMFISFGTEKANLSSYVSVINRNFYKRRFQLGFPTYAIAKKNNNVTYEIIYLPVLDKLTNSDGTSIPKSFVFNGITYYPPSAINMRRRLAEMLETTENLNPKFTKTIQPAQSSQLGFITYVPLCFVLPNYSQVILRKIQDSGFKFNRIDFEIDRIFVQESSDNVEPHFLLLPIE